MREGRFDWRKSTRSLTEAQSRSAPLEAGKFFHWVLAFPASAPISSLHWLFSPLQAVCQGGKAYLLAVAPSFILLVARRQQGFCLCAVPSIRPVRQRGARAVPGVEGAVGGRLGTQGVPELPTAFHARGVAFLRAA